MVPTLHCGHIKSVTYLTKVSICFHALWGLGCILQNHAFDLSSSLLYLLLCNPKMTRILIVIKIHGIESKQNIHNIKSTLRGLKSFAFKQISGFTLHLSSLQQDPDINVSWHIHVHTSAYFEKVSWKSIPLQRWDDKLQNNVWMQCWCKAYLDIENNVNCPQMLAVRT